VITSPEGLIFDGKAKFIVVPAADGELGILPRHAPLIAALGFGALRIDLAEGETGIPTGADGKVHYFVEGGFVQVLDNVVTVLPTRAEPMDSLLRAAEEQKLQSFLGIRPPKGADIEAVEEYERQVQVARRRVQLAR
jgi:F-type H+-transporting ATPase subunit epsilon